MLKVTVVGPIGKTSGALLVIVKFISTLSVAVAASKKAAIDVSVFAVPFASVDATVVVAGAVTTGAV